MELHPAYPYLESINTRYRSKRKRVSSELLMSFPRKGVKTSITYECDFEIVKICQKHATIPAKSGWDT